MADPFYVNFTIVFEMAVVERIPQNPPNQVVVDFEAAFESLAALLRENPVVGEKRLHRVKGGTTRRIQFEGALDNGRNARIDDNRLGSFVVQVANRGSSREMPHTRLVLKPSLRVAGELVAILFRLDKLMAQVGFALGSVFKPEGREFQVREQADVEKVDDLAAVLALA